MTSQPTRMGQIFPAPQSAVDPVKAYGRLPESAPGRPALRMNMISSADGAGSYKDETAGLGGAADHAVFATLRSLADVILVGAGTMRAEGYGPATLDSAARTRRQGWGLPPVPPIAVLTRTCQLDWQAPFFTEAERRPLVLTTSSADAADRQRAAGVADVVVTGDVAVDLGLALRCLADRGVENVLAEGGPRVSSQLAAADLVDELCLTLAPMVVAGTAARILNGIALDQPLRLELAHVLESEGYLFLRYRRAQPPVPSEAPSESMHPGASEKRHINDE